MARALEGAKLVSVVDHGPDVAGRPPPRDRSLEAARHGASFPKAGVVDQVWDQRRVDRLNPGVFGVSPVAGDP